MNKITLRSKVKRDKEGDFTSSEFNHIEDGWVEGDYPKPLSPTFENQKAWSKSEWQKEKGHLDSNSIVVRV